jgi:hypothetical protein
MSLSYVILNSLEFRSWNQFRIFGSVAGLLRQLAFWISTKPRTDLRSDLRQPTRTPPVSHFHQRQSGFLDGATSTAPFRFRAWRDHTRTGLRRRWTIRSSSITRDLTCCSVAGLSRLADLDI